MDAIFGFEPEIPETTKDNTDKYKNIIADNIRVIDNEGKIIEANQGWNSKVHLQGLWKNFCRELWLDNSLYTFSRVAMARSHKGNYHR